MKIKKLFLPIILFCLLSIIFVPFLVKADGLVPCDTNCGISDFFTMLGSIYSFLVLEIATPLAVVALTIGGIIMMISAGNPNLMSLGKKIFYAAIIGLALAFCSYLIIKFVLGAVGYTGSF